MVRRLPRDYLLDRFDLVVILCLIDYALLVMVDSEKFIGLIVVVPIVLTVVFAHRASASGGPWLRVGRVALSVAGLLALINAFSPHPNIAGTICLLFAFSLVLSMVVLFRHVLGATDISAQSMYAALGCYLLLGLTFALADQSAALFYGSFFAQGGHHPGGDFAYFSAITMTTVGYGDLTPGVGFAKSMAVLEAVMGQMILVTLVARTVAAVSQEQIRQRRHRKDT